MDEAAFCHKLIVININSYSPKAKWILLNKPRDEEKIRQYSLSLRRILIVLV